MLFIITLGYAQKVPALKVKDQNIGLSSLDIKVDIVGNIATTTYDMLYYNPTNEILEGELSFPLGKGHNVSRFALDVNGKLREAVVVDKELGRIAFEQVVREGVDPALLEKGTGNNYKARIYPIPANGYKRVVLAYEQELVFNDGAQFYNLPLSFKNKLKDFKLEILVYDQRDKPIVTKGNVHDLEFSNWKKNYKTSVSKTNYIPNKSLLIKIPVPQNAQKTIINDNFFYAYKTLSAKTKSREKPKTIHLFWDVSLSMTERDFAKEKAFINSYIKYLNDVTINLVTFSNTIKSQKTFKIKNGNSEDLINTLKHVIYDGGTYYDTLLNITAKADAILLFSDGMASLGELNITKKSPVFIINSITKTNHNLLNSISELSNGSYIDLNTTSNSKALALVKSEPYKFIGFTSYSKNIEVYPKPGVSVNSDFSISGKNFIKEKMELHFGYGDKIKETVIIDLTDVNSKNDNVKRIWAQKKLNDLEIKSKQNKTQIIKLGLEYKLVTDYTSLIVLDNVMDYIRYKITPPEELLEEYNIILAEMQMNDEKKGKRSGLLGLINTDNIDMEVERSITSEEVVSYRLSNGINSIEVDEIVVEELNEERISSEPARIQNAVAMNYESPPNDSINGKAKKYRGSLKVKDRIVKTDYIKALQKAKNKNEAYTLYLTQRNKYLKTPSYYVDVSNHFARTFKDKIYADLILSNIAETDFDDYELLKVFAYQLQYDNQHDMAIFIFKRILELRPEDSQSYRDLAIAYQNVGKCQKALDLFNSILTGKIYKNGNRRVFEGMAQIAENEIKQLIRNYKNDLNLSEIDSKFIDEVYYDIRVVVDWNHNDTDIDLHIIDPNLEECFYSHPKTKIGGQMSPDMTQGFGPEEFILKKAVKGDYFIKIKYYGDRYQKIENPTFMKVTVYKNYGTNDESKSVEIIRLTKSDDQEIVAKLSF
ncbi:hypothetical protein FBALC1_13192 [Flavobacteriales bacterium ALC-1]|nr:hypothetical protein FBALC1_13192 [Flavobacteriales bacterium ALC-1]